jgi:cytochrome P450
MTVNPDVQRKLRAHVLERIPEVQDRPPTFEDLTPTKLPYLEAVIQETLRLSRTAGGYSREGKFVSSYHVLIWSCTRYYASWSFCA